MVKKSSDDVMMIAARANARMSEYQLGMAVLETGKVIPFRYDDRMKRDRSYSVYAKPTMTTPLRPGEHIPAIKVATFTFLGDMEFFFPERHKTDVISFFGAENSEIPKSLRQNFRGEANLAAEIYPLYVSVLVQVGGLSVDGLETIIDYHRLFASSQKLLFPLSNEVEGMNEDLRIAEFIYDKEGTLSLYDREGLKIWRTMNPLSHHSIGPILLTQRLIERFQRLA